MANSLSAKKRVRQNIKHRARNRWRKDGVRRSIKTYDELILHGSVEDARKHLDGLYKLIDQVAAKGVMHHNAANRTKSRLAVRLNHKQTQGAAA